MRILVWHIQADLWSAHIRETVAGTADNPHESLEQVPSDSDVRAIASGRAIHDSPESLSNVG